ncbi:MAG: efflux transporter periplasmic adaptor subunit [Phenylobacterium sp. RIFCSPHIGHO2_01_FULL_69_31]|uniref:efflux RND transporter periplasmic adaptor subunit n=1 Tax=Phenylobacterium sp. RIFCSPHIGHO2_01_FULL_69_31 TaxID=1801944 RepID=UPI0008BDF288|nr:efflux RND transporter periplasmic adaptor subunit [Phenylobacterium sp. RIFCSPHIGHO2_01_FULL_69_31]OHB27046.1 MAG: efflux transporter periplasmic adaptor subunit [Phenylobacterium sp. RIFCSPHIGHO2_01_FULL_69_31]
MIRRHFFLVAALVVLAVMVVVGGYKVLTKGTAGAGGGPGMAQGGAPQGKGGGGRGGAFGGPTLVSVATVQPRVFEETIEVLGVAKGRQSVTLTAAATQLVERVRFSDGQRVPRGAVLVELKDTEQNAGVAQAEARQVEARRAYDRYRSLGEQGWASKAQVDQYEAAWRSAQADVAAAKARQGDRMIRAPFAGVVGLSDVAPGALVNPGAPIVTLDDVSVIRVDFQVPERYLGQLREGQSLLATADAYPGETITGRIAQLDTRVDERTRAITARAEFPNASGKLKPGMLIRVGVSRGQRTNPSAPEAAISVQGDAAFVYVLQSRGQGTMVEQRPIVTGLRQHGFVEITDGAKPGERIVADGLNKIQPGQPVRVAGAAPPAAGARPATPRPAA